MIHVGLKTTVPGMSHICNGMLAINDWSDTTSTPAITTMQPPPLLWGTGNFLSYYCFPLLLLLDFC